MCATSHFVTVCNNLCGFLMVQVSRCRVELRVRHRRGGIAGTEKILWCFLAALCTIRGPFDARPGRAGLLADTALTFGPQVTKIPGSVLEGYPSGQRGQTVNLLAYAFGGSNPPPSTSNWFRTSGSSSMVELQPSKLIVRVRFPSPAPLNECRTSKCSHSSVGRALPW